MTPSRLPPRNCERGMAIGLARRLGALAACEGGWEGDRVRMKGPGGERAEGVMGGGRRAEG